MMSTSWIRSNMFPTPEEGVRGDANSRRLTEAELRVKRSLEKLSIPEWYLSSTSKPPKIRTNDTPIEYRPAPWKIDKNNPTTFVLSNPHSKENNKSVFSGKPSFYTPQKLNQKYQKMQVSSAKSPENAIGQNDSIERWQSKHKKRLNTSGTFPRMSVSRKIKNINIVLPRSPPLNLSMEALDGSYLRSTKDDSSAQPKPIQVTDLDDPDPECLRIRRQTYAKSRSPPMRENADKSIAFRTLDNSGQDSYKVRASSTPEGSFLSIISTASMASPISRPVSRKSFFNPGASSTLKKSLFFVPPTAPPSPPPVAKQIPKAPRMNAPKPRVEPPKAPPAQPTLPKKRPEPTPPASSNLKKLEICDTCKANNICSFRLVPVSPAQSPRISPIFRSPLLPIREDQQMTLPRQSPRTGPRVALIISRQKSPTMEKILRKKQAGETLSLVQEIIDELQENCRSSPKKTYSSPGAKNFVRKLVRALEKTDIDFEGDNRYEQCRPKTETCYSSESSSDGDIKSAASSTSLSAHNSNSGSDTGSRSPVLSSEPDYDWVVKAKDEEAKLKEKERKKEEDDDSVFWIPVKKTLPRSGSTFRFNSHPVTKSSGVSPIRLRSGSKPFQWRTSDDSQGNTYKKTKGQLTKGLLQINEKMDSGYSDRSSAADAPASVSDSESTQSPSDGDSVSGILAKRQMYRDDIFIGQSIIV